MQRITLNSQLVSWKAQHSKRRYDEIFTFLRFLAQLFREYILLSPLSHHYPKILK